jgi:hypothetical protein
MKGTGDIKYMGQTKTSTAALRLTEGSVKARGRKSQKKKKIPWPSRLGVVQRASYPSMENICKLKTLNEGTESDGLLDANESKCKRIQLINYVLAPGMLKCHSNLVRCKNWLRNWLKHNLK